MKVTREGDRVVVRCPAKLNLFLEVHGRRPDGYHEIETVMQPVTLYDDIALAPRADGRVAFDCSSPNVPDGPENLAWRAADCVRAAAGLTGGVSISLEKRIPPGAGLGGGSSDAAGVLAGMNELFGLDFGRDRLFELAAGLGSDVPFFLAGGTALCRGRGEDVTPVPVGEIAHYVICCPPLELSTAAVYENLHSFRLTWEKESARFLLESLARGDVVSIGPHLFNRLGEVAESLAPEVARAKDALSEAAAAPALVTGSGAASYVLVASSVRAKAIAAQVGEKDVGEVFVAQTEAR